MNISSGLSEHFDWSGDFLYRDMNISFKIIDSLIREIRILGLDRTPIDSTHTHTTSPDYVGYYRGASSINLV
ncbi:hypothetical protein AA0118_g11492 [Alternaria tenuissima]|jgi:hypothetical protein|nr:hypothetical protein AA0118_g11492 [Alternaria tenuissima]